MTAQPDLSLVIRPHMQLPQQIFIISLPCMNHFQDEQPSSRSGLPAPEDPPPSKPVSVLPTKLGLSPYGSHPLEVSQHLKRPHPPWTFPTRLPALSAAGRPCICSLRICTQGKPTTIWGGGGWTTCPQCRHQAGLNRAVRSAGPGLDSLACLCPLYVFMCP